MKDKGFTLVELLATMVILAILILVGTMTVSNIFDNSKDNYYKSLENTLSIAGNEYFNDNREDKPIDDYNFVDMDTLVSHEYMEDLKTFDGKETCKSETGVFIYNDSETTGYEVCLVCGDYKSGGDFCNGKKLGIINITGNINDPSGPVYNPLLSYSGTKWINAGKVYIHFNLVDEGVHVSNYKIYNSNNSFVGDCAANSSNYCRKEFQSSGSYYVEAYDGPDKVANRKYFNIKIDNVPPTMDLKNLETNFLLDDDKIVLDYENEVINIHDDNGYKEVKYTLTRYKPTGPEYIARDKDLKETDLKINESLQSGKYDLYITVTDFAGNVATQSHTHIEFYIKYKVDLQYFDRNDNKHDVGNIKVYTYGKYTDLPGKVNVNSNPQEVSWYTNANMIGTPTTKTTTVEKTTSHVLYGKEDKLKVTFGATCNDITYDTKNHKLATIPQDEQGKYRLMVYYGGTLMANEAKDARTYTVIAMLNPGYTWDNGTTTAKAIKCEILPKRVAKPTCDSKIYNGTSQQIVKPVDSSGNYSVYAGEVAYSLGKKPFGINAGYYSFTVSLNDSNNYAWENVTSTSNMFANYTLACEIDPKPIPFNYACCTDCVFNGSSLDLVTGFELEDYGVEDSQGLRGLMYFDDSVDSSSLSTEEYDELFDRLQKSAEYENFGDAAIAINSDMAEIPVFSVNPFTASNAGSYKVEFEIHNENYVFEGGAKTKSLNCKISPASFKIEWDKVEFKYDGEKHVATLSEQTLSGLGTSTGYGEGGFFANITYHITGEETEPGDQYKAKFVCDNISDYNDQEWLNAGCSNISFSNTTTEFEIYDRVSPSCSFKLLNESGMLNIKASDNHGIGNLSFGLGGQEVNPGGCRSNNERSFTYDFEAAGPGTYNASISDCSGNIETCSITIKEVTQKRTKSCDKYYYGSTCVTWGKWGDYGGCNYYSDIGANKSDTECRGCGDGSKYECRTRSCSSYNKTGCKTWGEYSAWSDSKSCTKGESSDHSTYTDCQDIYRKS